MNTPYRQKFVALAKAVITSPRDVPGWLVHLPAWGRRPADVELPWWSYGAIRYLQQHLRPIHRVFEFGSGGSSFFVARRASSVLAVENDPEWHRLVSGFAQQRGLTNLVCELHPLEGNPPATFPTSSFCQRVRSAHWDVVIVDCHIDFEAGHFGVTRPAAFAAALPQINPGGFVIVDDSWMYPDLLVPREGWEIRDFVGTGPCRYGVTSTAILRKLV